MALFVLCLQSSAFKIGGGRHAACGAHSDHGAMSVTPAELHQRLAEIADARHAVGMSERNRATNDIGGLPRRFELRLICEALPAVVVPPG